MTETSKSGISAHVDKFWWVYLIVGLLGGNWIGKNNFFDGMLSECHNRKLNVNCTCIATEGANRVGPLFILLPLKSESELSRIAEDAIRYCLNGG